MQQAADTVDEDVGKHRLQRCAFSGSCLLLFAFIVHAVISDASANILVNAGVVVCYYVAELLLLIGLAAVLYQQHEMRQFRFGIGAIMIVTAMLALPMGIGSHLFRTWPDVLTLVQVIFVVFLLTVVSLLPLVNLAEGLMFIAQRMRDSKNRQGYSEHGGKD